MEIVVKPSNSRSFLKEPQLRTCPCCGYRTIASDFEICSICWWQHDPAQESDPDDNLGANPVSLRQAQENYRQFGASRAEVIKHVEGPSLRYLKDLDWKPL